MRFKTLLLAAALVSVSPSAQADPISALYVFGDSLSDNGNLSAVVATALPGTVVPAPPYAPGRASNGAVAAELLASALGLPPLLPVALGGTNYAVIGAATGNVPFPIPGDPGNTADNVAEALGLPLPVPTGILTAQLPLFASLLTGPIDPDALFLIWGGPNDLVLNPSTATAQQAANNVATAVTALHSLGARRFLVPNMPNLGRTPGAGASAPALTALTVAFNTQLAGNLALLGALPAVQVTPFDTFALFEQAALDPAAFGLTNVVDACVAGNVLFAVRNLNCGLDDEAGFLFWDGTHPTTAGHQMLGAGFAAAVTDQPVPEPATLVLALAGLAGLAARRRRAA